MNNKKEISKEIKEEVKPIKMEPMGDDDIKHYLPDAKIIKYNELLKYDDINQLLNKPVDYCIILYENSDNNGHWVCVLKYGGIYEFFDSYGGAPDSQLNWNSCPLNKELKQNYTKLTELLNKVSNKTIYNPIQYQSNNLDITTCGRHCVFRIKCMLNNNLDLPSYYYNMKKIKDNYKLSYDDIVSHYIDKI